MGCNAIYQYLFITFLILASVNIVIDIFYSGINKYWS